MDIMRELAQAGAVYTDRHFVYSSGKHGSGYINMDPLFTDPGLVWRLGGDISRHLLTSGVEFDTIASPATGAIALLYPVAFNLLFEEGKRVHTTWADKVKVPSEDGEEDEDDFAFERAGFAEKLADRQVLIVEDLLTTGGSVAKVCRQVELEGGRVIGVCAVCNRGGVTHSDLRVPWLGSLSEVDFEAVEHTECPLCENNVPIVTDVGHGARFEKDNPDYPGGYVKLLG